MTVTIPTADVLVNQCISGDATAYRLLYERYARAMYNTALRITGSRPDAEDILQDAFTDAFFQLEKFEQKASFGTWIRKIVIYKSIALLKKRRIHWVELEVDLHDNAINEEFEVDNIEFTVSQIKEVLQTMPDGYRTVLSLYLLEGYDQEEIASIIGVAASTVRSQYIRGRQKLVQHLKRRNHEEK